MANVFEISDDSVVNQIGKIQIGIDNRSDLNGLVTVLREFFNPINDANQRDDRNEKNSEEIKTELKELTKLNKKLASEDSPKTKAFSIMQDASKNQQLSSQIGYRISSELSNYLTKLTKFEIENANKQSDMINTLTKANVLIDTGEKDFTGKLTELSNKVGIGTNDLVKNMAANSVMINRINAMNRNGVEEYTNALAGWSDVVGMSAEEAPAVMEAIEGLTSNMTRAQFEMIDMRQMFKDVATNTKGLSRALGISTEELIKINKRQEKNLALEGFKVSSPENNMILNGLRAKGLSDDAITYAISGKMTSEVAQQMTNPYMRNLLNTMRQRVVAGDNFKDFMSNIADSFNAAVDYGKEYKASNANSLVGAYSEVGSFLYNYAGTLNNYIDKKFIDEYEENQKNKDNGGKVSKQYEAFDINRELDIALTRFNNSMTELFTPTTDVINLFKSAITKATNAVNDLIPAEREQMRNIITGVALAGPVLDGIRIFMDIIPSILHIATSMGKGGWISKLGGVGMLVGGSYMAEEGMKDLFTQWINSQSDDFKADVWDLSKSIRDFFGMENTQQVNPFRQDNKDIKKESPAELSIKNSTPKTNEEDINKKIDEQGGISLEELSKTETDYNKINSYFLEEIDKGIKYLIQTDIELSSYLKRKQA